MWAAFASEHGIEHHILTLENPPTSTNTQQHARELRYQMLSDFCQKQRILHLLTAHHADDNIETFIMRKKRSNNGEGLAGIPFIRYTNHLRLIRPLLNIGKRELVGWLTEKNIKWVEDPSNQSPSYERNRVRKELAAEPIDEASITQSIHRAAMQKSAAQDAQNELAIQSLRFFKEGYLELDIECWQQFEDAHINHLLAQICYSIGKAGPPPRYRELEHLAQQLRQADSKAACLAGLQFKRISITKWRITREFAHVQPAIELQAGTIHHWDGRFEITCRKTFEKETTYSLRALGEDGLNLLRNGGLLTNSCHANLPRAALLTLPSIWRLDQPHYVPHIDIDTEENELFISIVPRWHTPTLRHASPLFIQPIK